MSVVIALMFKQEYMKPSIHSTILSTVPTENGLARVNWFDSLL